MAAPVRIYFLGGLGEIGRNCMVLEQNDKLLLIDCGLMFPDADMHGIDLVLPDFTFLRDNAERIVGCVATHGHEDHVGGLQFLLRDVEMPIYGSAVTLGLARSRIEEAGLLNRTQFVEVRDGQRIDIGGFDVEFLPVTHSVPHAHAIIVHTQQGVIVHSGDFKLDLTPVDDRRTDLARLGELSSTVGIRGDTPRRIEGRRGETRRKVGPEGLGLLQPLKLPGPQGDEEPDPERHEHARNDTGTEAPRHGTPLSRTGTPGATGAPGSRPSRGRGPRRPPAWCRWRG